MIAIAFDISSLTLITSSHQYTENGSTAVPPDPAWMWLLIPTKQKETVTTCESSRTMSKFLIILLLLWCKLCSLGNGLSTKRSIQPIQRRHLLLKPKNTESKSNNNSNWIAAGESSHGQEERQDVAVVTATAASHPFGNKVNEFTDFLHWDVFRYFGHEFCGRYSNKLNCYEILGFTKKDSPSTADITKNYRRLSRQWHPDKNKERISLERFVVSQIC